MQADESLTANVPAPECSVGHAWNASHSCSGVGRTRGAASAREQRGRLHEDFLDVLLDQPVGQAAQIGRRRPDLLAVEVKVAIDLDVGHHDREHLLVDGRRRLLQHDNFMIEDR